jgi:prepilin-type N-terminal cleavage/methylation domain-containing protein
MRNGTSRSPVGARAGFTLLEVVLSLTIGVLLLAALYAAVEAQLKNVQNSQEQIEASTLARSLCNRIQNDVSATVGLSDPARFRRTSDQSGGGGGGGGGASSPSSSSPTTGSSTSNSSANNATNSTSPSSASSATSAPAGITIPLGVQGDNSTLNLYLSRSPMEVWNTAADGSTVVVSDTRRITYWMANGDNGGLARHEIKVATSPDSTTDPIPANVDMDKAVIAPEVRSVQFRYFDGSNWQDTWDSTTMGADGVTPIGSPRAIEITLEIVRPGKKDQKTRKYRNVVFIPTANGTTQQPDTPQPTGAGATAGQ